MSRCLGRWWRGEHLRVAQEENMRIGHRRAPARPAAPRRPATCRRVHQSYVASEHPHRYHLESPDGALHPGSTRRYLRITDMNWMQVEKYLRHDDRAVLPLGSTEQHSHLATHRRLHPPRARRGRGRRAARRAGFSRRGLRRHARISASFPDRSRCAWRRTCASWATSSTAWHTAGFAAY